MRPNSPFYCCGGDPCDDGKSCVDGQCCNTACTGKCQACSAAKTGGTDGVCGNIPSGSDPDGECTYSSPNCGVGDTCNGAGACRPAAAGVACAATTCSGSTLTGSLCNNSGTCVSSSTSCGNYLCANGTSCGTTCTGDGQCIATAYCRTSDDTCRPDLNDGLTCSSNSQCKNGHCVDGVCCETACAGACQACSAAKKGLGVDGVCDDVKAGTDPDNNCAAEPASSCQNDGFCDGQGACRQYSSATSCGSGQCSGSTLIGFHCDGFGACVNGETSCGAYLCAAASCPTSCGNDNACAPGNYCVGNKCMPKLDDGTECSAGRECSSGFCVENVCCDSACDGTCQACTATNKASGEDGVCGDAKAGTDAHDDCADEGALTCKRDGTCDGAGACRLYLEGIPCGETNCEDNVQTGHACDGNGTCLDNSEHACGLYVCRGAACTIDCSEHADCSTAAYCNVTDGTCEEKLVDGQPCDEPANCASNLCVDGVCCNKACAGQCEACDVVTAPGTCSPIVGQPHGIRPACDPGTEGDACSARACDGEQDNTSCVGFVGSEVTCREQTCADGIETFSATCDKAGSCGAVKTKKCEPYVCQGDGCGAAPCESDADCAPKFRCDSNKKDCVPKDVASCDGDHVITNPDGTTSDCAPFKCEGSVCKDTCASVKDCVSGYVCNAAKACVAPSSGSDASGGCACRAAGGNTKRAPLWLSLLALTAAALRGRRRHSKPARSASRI
jgi:MYXO-CTERM domain-containing protein